MIKTLTYKTFAFATLSRQQIPWQLFLRLILYEWGDNSNLFHVCFNSS